MCNVGGRQVYGRDALVAGPVHEYEVSPDYSQSPEQHAVLPFYDNEDGECFILQTSFILTEEDTETLDLFYRTNVNQINTNSLQLFG